MNWVGWVLVVAGAMLVIAGVTYAVSIIWLAASEYRLARARLRAARRPGGMLADDPEPRGFPPGQWELELEAEQGGSHVHGDALSSVRTRHTHPGGEAPHDHPGNPYYNPPPAPYDPTQEAGRGDRPHQPEA